MKSSILFVFALVVLSATTLAQDKSEPVKKETVSIYNPKANAQADINSAAARAKKTGKHVLVQVGGNWCIWCIRFHNLVNDTPELKKYMDTNFEWVLVNWSPEVKNTAVLNKLGNPGRFGYPVFVVLDGNGKVLHIQDSAYLERDPEESKKDGSGHNVKKTMGFLKNWTFAATHVSAK